MLVIAAGAGADSTVELDFGGLGRLAVLLRLAVSVVAMFGPLFQSQKCCIAHLAAQQNKGEVASPAGDGEGCNGIERQTKALRRGSVNAILVFWIHCNVFEPPLLAIRGQGIGAKLVQRSALK